MLEDRKKRVRDLYYLEGKNTREIAKIERISIRDMNIILKEEEARKQSLENDFEQQKEDKQSTHAYGLFNKGLTPIDVAIKLGLREPQVSQLYKEYLCLKGFPEIVSLREKIGDGIWSYLELYNLSNSSGLTNKEIVKAVDIALNKLPSADEKYFLTRKKINELFETERQLLDSNEALKVKNFSLLNEVSDREAEKHKLVEYCDMRKREVEELRNDEQNIRKMMDRYQKMLIGNISGAFYVVLKTIFEEAVKRATEIQEMHAGDIV